MKLTKKKKSKKTGLVGIFWTYEILSGRAVIIDGIPFLYNGQRYKSYIWNRWWLDGYANSSWSSI